MSTAMCLKHICIEISEDLTAITLRTVNGDSNSMFIEVDSAEEVVEVLEELADIATALAQYIAEVMYTKRF